MSYTFTIRAANKAEALAKCDEEFAKVVANQAIHAKDTPAARSAVEAMLEAVPEVPESDLGLMVGGYVSWDVDERITQANVSVTISTIARTV